MKKVRAVIARPKEEAHIEYITPELSTLQKIVEGSIELAIMADEWLMYVNDEGKINGRCFPNRSLDMFGLSDMAFGAILCLGSGESGTESLSMTTAEALKMILNTDAIAYGYAGGIGKAYAPHADEEIPEDFEEPEVVIEVVTKEED